MSSVNPYQYDDNFDEDIFEEEGKVKHVLDGSICPECGVSHDTSAIGGPDIAQALLNHMPPDLSEELLKSFPVSNELRDASDLVKILYGVVSNLDTFRPEAASIEAIILVLDELTGGKVSRISDFFRVERKLTASIYIKERVARMIVDAAERDTKVNKQKEIVQEAIKFWQEFLQIRCDFLKEDYIRLGDQTELDIDYRLINEEIADIDRTKKIVEEYKFNEIELGATEIVTPNRK